MPLSDDEFMRYSRQILLPEVGELGQSTLKNAKVLIVGVGGLGQLAAQYLAAAGVGHLTLVDDDRVESSNLPRQLLFDDKDIGEYKSTRARDKLIQRYPNCEINGITKRLSLDNASSTVEWADIVLDCSDNLETRHRVNQTCVSLHIPLVTASVAHFSGYLFTVDLKQAPNAGCYTCLFPQDSLVTTSCSTAGVLGPMVGTLASMQSLMAINLLLGIGKMFGKLLRFDGLKFKWREASLSRNPKCPVCVSVIKPLLLDTQKEACHAEY
ncbi:HesA/MoeB/ThiF family protein [Shewanella sp. D64]|uniref:HesA/MoeB/ThiF family protein n=1 Tax=unclassified Shewanella TaxID=196818 RepID=UPI0022BA30BE|nr:MULTISPECIES: HesA/MoeB/ThiF family protein [unclassified Shewanella]MEC4725287.1 HesA/MoeB/ThiF family protein [Shewanella sp. D64]MEC4735867.1 HesA/MoeB/ThiF family protein [Shewanella sp. E94]WBJ93164.1 HesA/MoeB/ThiF family protein [Shewanella sp. MTB7]